MGMKKCGIALGVAIAMPLVAHAQTAQVNVPNPTGQIGYGRAQVVVPFNCIAPPGDSAAGLSVQCGTHGTTAPSSFTSGPKDNSANAATVPIAGYQLLTTVAPNSARLLLECMNQDTSQVQLVLDDGNSTAGTVSTEMLQAAPTTGSQGASYANPYFKGRLRAYGPSATQRVMCRQD